MTHYYGTLHRNDLSILTWLCTRCCLLRHSPELMVLLKKTKYWFMWSSSVSCQHIKITTCEAVCLYCDVRKCFVLQALSFKTATVKWQNELCCVWTHAYCVILYSGVLCLVRLPLMCLKNQIFNTLHSSRCPLIVMIPLTLLFQH